MQVCGKSTKRLRIVSACAKTVQTMSNTRVSLDMNDEQMETLKLVQAHMSKKMGSPMSAAVVIRAALKNYAKMNRLEGNDAEDSSRSRSQVDS